MMSSKQGGSDRNGGDCDCEYEAGNKRHQESYWEGRSDPRDKDEKAFRFNSNYYAAMDRQIAENHATDPERQGKGTNNGPAKK